MSKKPRLSEKDDLELTKYIYYYQKVHGSAPSIREIRDHLHLKSHSAVQRRIQMLIDMGYLDRRDGMSRGLQVKRKGIIAFREHERKIKKLMKYKEIEWQL